MFRLHEFDRRRWCRLLFVVCCLLPTAGVLAWGAARRLPTHVTAYETELSDRLGLCVTLTDVTHPRPGAVLFYGLRLADPETDQTIASCRLLEASSDDATLALRASAVELDAEQLVALWPIIERRLRVPRSAGALPIRLLAKEVTWRWSGEGTGQNQGRSQTFTDLSGRLGTTDKGQELDLTFRLAGERMPEPLSLRVTREQSLSPPTTEVQLSTGSSPLPCSVFAPVIDGAAWFGPACTFRGGFWLRPTPQGWEAELRGQLDRLDLDTLVSQRYPHTLSGIAALNVESARVAAGRLVEATGTFNSGPGVISRTLLSTGVEMLHFGGAAEMLPPDSLVPFERLGFGFKLDATGLSLLGHVPSDARHALLVDVPRPGMRRALWTEPAAQPQPVVALARALVPGNEVQVPATLESDWLLQHLPLPPIVQRRDSSSNRLPNARLRQGEMQLR